MDEDLYKSRGGQIPIRWTSIEVRQQLSSAWLACNSTFSNNAEVVISHDALRVQSNLQVHCVI